MHARQDRWCGPIGKETDSSTFKAAVPLAGGVLCQHFGKCELFAVMEIQNGQIDSLEFLAPPPHEPGVLPRWLEDLGVNLIIAGGMGQRALNFFAQGGVRVITGAPDLGPETLIKSYLSGTLVSGLEVCDH